MNLENIGERRRAVSPSLPIELLSRWRVVSFGNVLEAAAIACAPSFLILLSMRESSVRLEKMGEDAMALTPASPM